MDSVSPAGACGAMSTPTDVFREDVATGLRAQPKLLPPKYFYDEKGSALYDRITELDAYYPCRTELAIFRDHLTDIARLVGAGARVVEPGAGASTKSELLLAALPNPACYCPIDISPHWMEANAAQLRASFPTLKLCPIVADFMDAACDLSPPPGDGPALVFFPGSTIGNLRHDEAASFLSRMRRTVGDGGMMLVGVDQKKDAARLIRAYDDEEGVTAAFNLNLLTRINAELGGDFDVPGFRHVARYDERIGRVEMHLLSTAAQEVHVAGEAFAFAAGETICTEYSYKYSVPQFTELAAGAGWSVRGVWQDDRRWFADFLLTAAPQPAEARRY